MQPVIFLLLLIIFILLIAIIYRSMYMRREGGTFETSTLVDLYSNEEDVDGVSHFMSGFTTP